jgi:hypothetical protein
MAAAVFCRIIIIIAIILSYHFVVPVDVSERRPIDIQETTASSPWSPWSQQVVLRSAVREPCHDATWDYYLI